MSVYIYSAVCKIVSLASVKPETLVQCLQSKKLVQNGPPLPHDTQPGYSASVELRIDYSARVPFHVAEKSPRKTTIQLCHSEAI